MVFSVQILGSNSALAAHGRHPSSQVVQFDNELFLVDCGEGTQMQMSAFHVRRNRIGHIFISHLHGDHYFGLIGLITSYHLMGRTNPLTVFGPAGLEDIIRLQLEYGRADLQYELTFETIRDDAMHMILETEKMQVYSFPLKHRIPTTGFLFTEKIGQRRIVPGRLRSVAMDSDLYSALKEGRDITDLKGVRYRNEDLTLPPYPVRSYAYCSDTVYDPGLKDFVEGVDLMYHEATFLEDSESRAHETFHSTTTEAAKVAGICGAGNLLIGHFSSKYRDLNIPLEECRSVFPETHIAIEGETYIIPRQIEGTEKVEILGEKEHAS